MTTEDRFWTHTRREKNCIIWQGKLKKRGEGTFTLYVQGKQKRILAHRFAYEMQFGPIPEGLLVLQTCRNRTCVNLEHLQLVASQRTTHRVTQVNEETHAAICNVCGPIKARRAGKYNGGRWRCVDAIKPSKPNIQGNNTRGALRYRRHKKDFCTQCGFKAEALCQLDVHHKDHNHANNDPSNLETLCANCHRLEHWRVRQLKRLRSKTAADPPMDRLWRSIQSSEKE